VKKKSSLKERIIKYVFTRSSQPVLFKDLLSANSHFNEKMFVDPGKLGFRRNITRAYIAYLSICAIILIPLLAITHYFLEHVDFHVSIISSVLVTSAVFIGFNYFYAWIRDAITLKLIKKAWLVHFPYFAYDKYNKKVEEIYNESLKHEVSKRDLQQYIMNKLTQIEE